MRSLLLTALAVVISAACAWAAVTVSAEVHSSARSANPADRAYFKDIPIERLRYDYADHCKKGSNLSEGAKQLLRWLKRNSPRGDYWGGVRCEKFSRGNYSLHSEGRAIDWALNSKNRAADREAHKLLRLWLGRDRWGAPHALARRMGVQGLIYNCRAWFGSSGGMGPYSYCYKDNGHREHGLDPTAAHKNHIHIELNKPGSRLKTSFWRSPFAP